MQLGDMQLGKAIVDAATVPLFDKPVCGDHIGEALRRGSSPRLFAEAIRHCRKDTGNGGKALEFRKIPMKKMVVDTGKIIVNRL
jgi:hypothetical protein